jgi:hypothetical protein
MPLDLSGCYAKIERAKKHISEFDRERLAFLDMNPYVVIPKFDLESNATQSIMGPLPILPDSLATIAGDAVQNLRTALDYLAAELVKVNGGDPKRVYFPIAESAEKYKSELSGKIKGISTQAIEVFNRIEPYGGGQGESLWILHSLNNADKHRLLVSVGSNIGRTVQINLNSPKTPKKISALMLAPRLEEGYVLGEIEGNTEPHNHLKFTFDIAFGQPEVLEGEFVVPTLDFMARYVESIVNYFAANF